ncbi:tetratricopeptide repeat protein [uncultured Kordia sp.]|uniref:tetratricopeptide repeat protein n=1 Tax=uncultured Kordia sp. TaxID=507699 RepID=UPI00261E700B|nr:tetratricopeptide repeat protein [uncultured Kordia sp.]
MPSEVAIIFMLALLTFRLLTTVIHELGHAIPALLLTKEKVTVYMGSLGNPEKSFQFQLGRLECFFKFNLFYWKGGLCVMHAKDISIRTSFIVTIFGPLLSLIVAGIGIVLLSINQYDNITELVIFALVFSCSLDFLNNIFPNRDAVTLHDGTVVHNDGQQLLHLWKLRQVYAIPKKALAYYDDGEFLVAAKLFETCIPAFPEDPEIYRLAISGYLHAKQDANAAKIQEMYSEKFSDSFDVVDFINLGNVALYKKDYHGALEAFKKAYEIEPTNPFVLNNYGFTLGVIGQHEEAISKLNTAIIEIEKDKDTSKDIHTVKAYSYCNRGFSKLELGLLEEGLKDTEIAYELDPSDAYVYRNFGLYHFCRKEHIKAHDFYQKAIDLDSQIPRIQEYIKNNNLKL